MRFFLFICLLFLGYNLCCAQDPVAEKMYLNRLSKPSTNLFVHFDKNIYSNNETIYFTGYVVKPGIFKFSDHKIMAVALIRDLDTAIIKQDKFVMQNGISFGSMVIPDSIATGNYHFLVYTDKLINQKPELVFKQAITLKTNIEPAFKANITLTEPATANNQQHKILLTVTSADNRFLTKPAVVNYKYGKLTKTAKTDASSQLLVSLPNQPNLIDPNLYVKLNYLKDSSFVSLALPQPKAKASVKFYPEGGNLVAGISANIAWEVTDQQRSPLALKAFLFKNNQVIDTIETSSYGIGKFRILPEQGSNYSVKLVHDNLADSVYSLPKILSNGLIISMEKAVVRDSVQFVMKSNIGNKFNIRLHNFEESFMYFPFDMEYKTRAVKIALTDIPKGLVSLTVSDTLDRPVAERLFFAHHDEVEQLALFTDKPNYGQREKVNLSLHLQDTTQHSLVSIAVVQDNRLNLKNTNDIRSYTYLKNELNKMPTNLNGNAFKDQDYIEQMLLVKGWRRYTWQDLPLTEIEQKRDSLEISGMIVTRNKKKSSKPIAFNIFQKKNIIPLSTDSTGLFKLKNNDVTVESGEKLYLLLPNKDLLTHQVVFNNNFSANSKKLLPTIYNDEISFPSAVISNREMVLNSKEKSIRLNEVVISKSRNKPVWGANKCGDYVCKNKILNCVNHPGDGGNQHPVVGKKYLTPSGLQIYRDCNDTSYDNFQMIDGIHLEKEFYLNDYNDPQEPAFFSTLYWNYNTLLKGNVKTDLSFYTSDITGKFKIIVQGVSNKDVIYSEHFFEVKPKQNP